jgi:hypothetical protein
VQKTPIVGAPGRGICSVLPLNVSMVHSPKLTIIADGKHQIGGSFTLGEIVCFRSLEIIADCFGSLSLSNEENASGAVLMRMTHSRSLSPHTILEDSVDEGDIASSGGRSSGFPISQECNVVTPSAPSRPQHHRRALRCL